MKYIPANQKDWIQGKGYQKAILLEGEPHLHCLGTLLQLLIVPPKTSVPFHYHCKGTEAFYMLKGKGIMNINQHKIHLQEGDLITCEPGEKHSTLNPYDEPFEYIVFKTNWKAGDTIWLNDE